MNDRARARLFALAGATVVCASLVTVQTGSAASLRILDPGVAQYWEFAVDHSGPPQVDLSPCGDLSQYDGIVYGTDGPDRLTGENKPQILVGLGGDDVLQGGNQHDCLIGGEGDDQLFGGNGKDVLVGGPGADHLDGGKGADTLIAGSGPGDVCVLEQGAQDTVVGTCGSS
jgi:Ca2+-binding RTX toxin-like protein